MAKKMYIWGKHICGELDAQKLIISFCTSSSQVLWAYIFKDVYVVGARFSCKKDLRLKKGKAKREEKNRNNGNKREKEMNKEFGARHRIFGVWPRSMGSALGDCLMHHAGGTLLQRELRQ